MGGKNRPAGQPWVDGLTIPKVLTRTVAEHPDRDALVFPQLNLRWSYRTFAERVDQAARGLMAIGIRRGEHRQDHEQQGQTANKHVGLLRTLLVGRARGTH